MIHLVNIVNLKKNKYVNIKKILTSIFGETNGEWRLANFLFKKILLIQE